ncbi:MAG: BamA/TamA family outer membrane protein [Candidatus Eisenbacteria bacterium]|uniref:BamA/TamA family outer membrane protein n=1 Tax=Eiseniibacteriota bacterium TaxID=2212470 RepID=A0A7Y2H274_UNCEI|nr:BamA/TamA family outer membrane protein [Candidatus Eisenbacteria bacterium]
MMHRTRSKPTLWILGVFLLASLCVSSFAEAQTRALTIEAIQIEGNSRTRDAVVLSRLGLEVGGETNATQLLAARDRLIAEDLFESVNLRTKRGSARGAVIVVVEVEERRAQVRFGLGREDLTGLYLIPLQLNLDNATGRGEMLRFSTRFGYRTRGLVGDFRSKPTHLQKNYWGARLWIEANDRIYFFEETEVNHIVAQGGLEIGYGFSLTDESQFEIWLGQQAVEAESTAAVYRDREVFGRRLGDEVRFEDLPESIKKDLVPNDQTRLRLVYNRDARLGAGLAEEGYRGRVELEGVAATTGEFLKGKLDLRGYQALEGNTLLAGRVQAGFVSPDAPFYEKFYLGGLYSVRGFPSQSLSPPEGHDRFAAVSAEVRRSFLGDPKNPRVTGLLFLDLGLSWNGSDFDLDETAAGVGYGIRVRAPWFGQIGLDIGAPLTDGPIKESFHTNLSLGWTF